MPTETVETSPARVALEKIRPDLAVQVAVTVKNGHAASKGDVLGKITSGGLFRRRTRSTVGSTGFTTGSDAGSVADSGRFKAGDVIKTLTGVKQQETSTVAGTIGGSGAGNATVVVTGALIPGGAKAIAVAVANNDTAAQVAGKIRTALAADGDVNDAYDVSGSSTSVVLTAKEAAAYDSTLNISVDNGTCSGLTTAATSANTTPGNAVEATIGTIESVTEGEDGDAIVLTGNASINAAEGAIVVGSDGSQVAAAIADEGSDGTGDTPLRVFIGGYLDEAQITGLDSSAKTDLNGLSCVGGIFKF